jgi:hydrogenase maturation protease
VSAPVVVIGIGNRYRRDDGSALLVLAALADRLPTAVPVVDSDGDPTRLIDSWTGADLAVVIETVRSGKPPGTVAVVDDDALLGASAESGRSQGSHSLGLLDAIALGTAVGRLPRRLRVVGIEPEDLGWGDHVTDAVAGGIEPAAEIVLDIVRGADGRSLSTTSAYEGQQ